MIKKNKISYHFWLEMRVRKSCKKNIEKGRERNRMDPWMEKNRKLSVLKGERIPVVEHINKGLAFVLATLFGS